MVAVQYMKIYILESQRIYMVIQLSYQLIDSSVERADAVVVTRAVVNNLQPAACSLQMRCCQQQESR